MEKARSPKSTIHDFVETMSDNWEEFQGTIRKKELFTDAMLEVLVALFAGPRELDRLSVMQYDFRPEAKLFLLATAALFPGNEDEALDRILTGITQCTQSWGADEVRAFYLAHRDFAEERERKRLPHYLWSIDASFEDPAAEEYTGNRDYITKLGQEGTRRGRHSAGQ